MMSYKQGKAPGTGLNAMLWLGKIKVITSTLIHLWQQVQ